MKRETLLIFDFDGTIADTKSIWYNSIHSQLKIFGFKYNELDKLIDLGLSLKKTLKKMGFGFLVSWFLHRRITSKVKSHVNQIRKCHDVDSLRSLKAKKILVTNSLKEFAVPILKHLKIDDEFSEVYGAEDFADKGSFLRDYIKKNNYKDCYYIGDRANDALVATRAGCKSILVSGKCAWNSRKQLLESEPDFLVSDLKDIQDII